MKRPWLTWCIYLACLTVVLAGLAWVSATLLRMDSAEEDMLRQAEVDENVRLALWRMERALAPIISQENARPHFVYQSFYPAQGAYTKGQKAFRYGDVLVPSPLLTATPPHVVVHFQYDPAGGLTSPQAPRGKMRAMADELIAKGATTEQRLETSFQCLDLLQTSIDHHQLALVCAEPNVWSNYDVQTDSPNTQRRLSQLQLKVTPQQLAEQLNDNTVQQELLENQSLRISGRARLGAPQQVLRNNIELAQRQNAYANSAALSKGGNLPLTAPQRIAEGLMTPVWIDNELILARRVVIDDGQYLQGCWLRWPDIRAMLMEHIVDLLPSAQLVPSRSEADGTAHVLASLPVQLNPGTLAFPDTPTWTPTRVSLAVVWGCVLLAVIAVTALLWGTVSLSERRGSFVSAVTHELRTPLTTLRMYTEMLKSDMVKDDAARERYLDTMHREADRLGHLVENVLAYARLERSDAQSRCQPITLAALLNRVRPSLLQRADQAGMTLTVANSNNDLDHESVMLQTDPAAVEQVLFNLVDNACKYGKPPEGEPFDRDATAQRCAIQLEAGAAGDRVVLRVKDRGAGIRRTERGRVFKPFRKSAQVAADSAPGVGLGLALCKRLARQLGGDLRLRDGEREGTCFILTLPRDV